MQEGVCWKARAMEIESASGLENRSMFRRVCVGKRER